MQQVETVLQQFYQLVALFDASVDDRDEHGFQFVRKIADLGQLGHARAALEGVQIALQLHHRGVFLGALVAAR